MGELSDRFCYVYSCDLDVSVQIKIGTLEGQRDRPSYTALLADPMLKFSGEYQDGCCDLYVTCQVYADGVPLAIPVGTSYKSFTTRWNWNEWLVLPVKYVDLPRNAVLGVTIWDVYGTSDVRPVGATTVTLFSKMGTFKKGMHDLKVWPGVVADGKVPSSTPGKVSDGSNSMAQLAKLSKKHRDGHMTKVDWLDRLTFREIEMIHEGEKRESHSMYLMVEFPHVHFDGTPFTIVYFEKGGDEPFVFNTHAELVMVPDPEISLENLAENKHHILARSLRSGPSDRDVKPDAKTRDLLNKIVAYPPTKQLMSEEQDLIWKFRFYLSNQPQALAKFLKCVTWSMPQETTQAVELMLRWAPMDPHDALELLSPTFTHPAVRKYAVKRLNQADTEDLLQFILQLVQALKYEDFDEIRAGLDASPAPRPESSSGTESPVGQQASPPITKERTASTGSQDSITDALTSARQEDDAIQEMDLTTFLISRACNNSVLANYFYWYLLIECEDQDVTKEQKVTDMYITVMKRFSKALTSGGKECRLRRSSLARQQMFMDKLVRLVKLVARESGNRLKKIERLQALLTNTEVSEYNFAKFEPLPLPLDPLIKVKAILPEKASIFKSALMPCRLTFRTEDDCDYVAIFKHGDDLRQDQLVLQIICLLDKLLRKENLDLKLTPYKVLATSSKHGFVQYIDSQGVADVLDKYGSIQNFFRKCAPSETGPYGIASEVMDNYIKSCAGYCMVTYLLGVGDRHLDNLLLTHSGKLFHIDYGYILGRDPKPLPPPMKLSREMVEAMGGTMSEHFHDFKKLCYTAFLHLRRSANLIINLFSLMVDANIPDIALEPDKTVKKVQDKFVLNLTDEEAVLYLQNLIDVSVSAMMAALVEQMHKIAQYWRK